MLALLLSAAGTSAAQDTSATGERGAAPPNSASAGRADGAAAAHGRGVGGYFAAGLLSGLAIGAAGPIGVGEASPDVPPLVITAAGVAGVVGVSVHAAHAGVTLPASDEALLRGHGDAYQKAFRDAYAIQVQRRRKHAALWGGLTGTAVGIGAVLFLLSHITT